MDMDLTKAFPVIWDSFLGFLQSVPPDAINTVSWLVLGISTAGLFGKMFRKGTPSWLVVAMPLMIWGLSALIWWMMTWGNGVMADFLSPWRTFFVLVGLVWSPMNLVRVAIGK